MVLSTEIEAKIKALCSYGDRLARSNRFEEAKNMYFDALELIPEPASDYEASTWIYVALGDANFRMLEFQRMKNCFIQAVLSAGGVGNPFIHLRLGQAFFELNELNKASEELTRAYMYAGEEIFEEDDPKYLEFLKTRILI